MLSSELGLGRLGDLDDAVDALPGVVDELGARLGVRLVAEACGSTGAALDRDGDPVEPRDRVRDERDAPLARCHLLRNAHPHAGATLSQTAAGGEAVACRDRRKTRPRLARA